MRDMTRDEEEKLLGEVYAELGDAEKELQDIKKLLDSTGIPCKDKSVLDRLFPVMMLWNSVDSSLRQRCLSAFS